MKPQCGAMNQVVAFFPRLRPTTMIRGLSSANEPGGGTAGRIGAMISRGDFAKLGGIAGFKLFRGAKLELGPGTMLLQHGPVNLLISRPRPHWPAGSFGFS